MHRLAMGGTADKKENRHRKRGFSRALTVFRDRVRPTPVQENDK